MTLKFGTDGVRGVANQDLTPELVVALGRAAARVLAAPETTPPGGRRFLVGRDSRVSGPLLQAAMSAGLAAEGVSVVDLGVLPTPGVAFESAARGLPAVMISASHNPFPDNGIKLFSAGGRKLDDDAEELLEAELARILSGGSRPTGPAGAAVGRLDADPRPTEGYARHLEAAVEGRRLDGLHVVIDCAHGAAFEVAPRVLGALGATVDVLGNRPDGTNINEGCGSTHPQTLQAAVPAAGADAGLAFDGDADRVLAVDHRGGLVDGDQLLALCALDLRARGRLRGDTVVVTVMTNLGFRRAMAANGVVVHETPVGDRHVLEALEAGGWSLGGEQSGHVIFRDLATTGDGILTGILLLDLLRRRDQALVELAGQVMTRLPQVLRNVHVPHRDRDVRALVGPAVEAVRAQLGERGRVLVRTSGTEPVVRVMVEATTEEEAEEAAGRLAAEVERAFGA